MSSRSPGSEGFGPPSSALLCSTAAFFARPLHEGFRLIAAAGFEAVEVMVTKDPATQEAHRICELSEAHGLAVRAVHAPFLLMTRNVWGTDPVGKIYRAIELAEEVGSPLVVVHPPYRWQTGYRRWLADQLPNLSAHTGVIVAVENMFPVKIRGERGVTFHADQRSEAIDRYPNVVLDTSHAAVAGLHLVETARRLGDRLVHVHLSNNAGKGWDSHLPVDRGVLDLGGFLADLAAWGFAGTISLELDLRQQQADEQTVLGVLVANRKFCEERLPPQDSARVAPSGTEAPQPASERRIVPNREG